LLRTGKTQSVFLTHEERNTVAFENLTGPLGERSADFLTAHSLSSEDNNALLR